MPSKKDKIPHRENWITNHGSEGNKFVKRDSTVITVFFISGIQRDVGISAESNMFISYF